MITKKHKKFSQNEKIVSRVVTQKRKSIRYDTFLETKLCQKAFSSLSDAKFIRTMNQIKKFKMHKIIKNSFANVFVDKIISSIQDEV
jgi:hypothetical protein